MPRSLKDNFILAIMFYCIYIFSHFINRKFAELQLHKIPLTCHLQNFKRSYSPSEVIEDMPNEPNIVQNKIESPIPEPKIKFSKLKKYGPEPNSIQSTSTYQPDELEQKFKKLKVDKVSATPRQAIFGDPVTGLNPLTLKPSMANFHKRQPLLDDELYDHFNRKILNEMVREDERQRHTNINIRKEVEESFDVHDGDLEEFGEMTIEDSSFSEEEEEKKKKKFICCYKDPNDPERNIGRPFLISPYTRKHFGDYMRGNVISKKDKQTLDPTPVTGCSTNHFREHLSHVEQVRQFFPGKKIVFYDLGLSLGEAMYLQNKTDIYIYRRLEYKNYPWHISQLKTYAWKVAIWAQVLPEFGSIIWFDTSIFFWDGAKDIINKKIRDPSKDSSWIYYIKSAAHDISSHSHPLMYSYFPSNITKHSHISTKMKMAGAVIIYNDDKLRDNIMKWALLCALTPDCIYPERSMKTCTPPSDQLYRQDKYRSHHYLKEFSEVNETTGIERDPELVYNNWHRTSDRTRYCHRFDQAMMSILIGNYYNFDVDKYFCHHTTSIAKPVRSGVESKFELKNVGSGDATEQLKELYYFVKISIEMIKNGTAHSMVTMAPQEDRRKRRRKKRNST